MGTTQLYAISNQIEANSVVNDIQICAVRCMGHHNGPQICCWGHQSKLQIEYKK